MRRAWLLPALLLPLAAPAKEADLDRARKGVEAGKPEEVLFALEGASGLDGAAADEAASLQARAAEASLAQGDAVLAFQLCQDALDLRPSHARALAACIDASRSLKQLDPAEKWTAALEKAHPKDPRGPLSRARLHADQGEWPEARAAAQQVLDSPAATAPQKQEARKLVVRSGEETRAEKQGLAQVKRMDKKRKRAKHAAAKAEARLEKTRTQLRKMERSTEVTGQKATGGGSGWDGVGPHVILYCDSSRRCLRARGFLQEHRIAFSERHVGRSRFAQEELAEHGYSQGSVPIYVMHGKATGSRKVVLSTLKQHGVLR